MIKKFFLGALFATLICLATALYATNLDELKKRAEAGDSSAQAELAKAYYNGEGVSKSLNEAFSWWMKSAQQGNLKSEVDVGICYLSGEGVQADPQKALEWINKAAAQNFDGAQYQLGSMYLVGDVVQKNKQQALEWYLKAANQGSAKAQFAVYNIYYSHFDNENDQKTAIEWLRKSAASGFVPAESKLGGALALTPKNNKEGIIWLEKAAEADDLEAQELLPVAYGGSGNKQDIVKAYKWLTITAAPRESVMSLPFPENRRPDLEDVEQVKKNMTSEQIAEGDKLVKQWKEKHPANK